MNTAWSARDLHADRPPDVREPVDVAGGRRLLDPVEVVLLEQPDPVDRGRRSQASFGSMRSSRPGPDRAPDGGDARVVALDAAADLEVDDLVPLVGQIARVGRERVGVVALQEAEVVDLLVHAAAEERPRRHAERAAERVPARDLDPGERRAA